MELVLLCLSGISLIMDSKLMRIVTQNIRHHPHPRPHLHPLPELQFFRKCNHAYRFPSIQFHKCNNKSSVITFREVDPIYLLLTAGFLERDTKKSAGNVTFNGKVLEDTNRRYNLCAEGCVCNI